jgi:hypothetical protein
MDGVRLKNDEILPSYDGGCLEVSIVRSRFGVSLSTIEAWKWFFWVGITVSRRKREDSIGFEADNCKHAKPIYECSDGSRTLLTGCNV